MRRVMVCLAGVLLAVSGCSSGDTAEKPVDGVDGTAGGGAATDTSDDGTGVDEGGAAQTGPRMSVFGTTVAEARDGFVTLDTDCATAPTVDAPVIAPVDLQLPPTWSVVGVSDGSSSGSVRVQVGGTERTFSVGLAENASAGSVEGALAASFPGGFDEIATVTWGAEQYPVGFDGSTYVAVMPGLRIDGLAMGVIEQYVTARVGDPGTGDISAIDQADVLAAFESISLDRCIADQLAGALGITDVVIVD